MRRLLTISLGAALAVSCGPSAAALRCDTAISDLAAKLERFRASAENAATAAHWIEKGQDDRAVGPGTAFYGRQVNTVVSETAALRDAFSRLEVFDALVDCRSGR